MKRPLILAGALLFFVAGVLIVVTALSMHRREEVTDGWRSEKWLTNYQLTERNGKPFDSRGLAGKVHVVSFFYSNCPGPCFNQNKAVQRFQGKFGERGVKFINITCDPDSDTPAVLSKYARDFEAQPGQWYFLTGELLHIERIAAEIYSVHVSKGQHMESLLVIDKWGTRRGNFNWKKPEDMAEMERLLKKLLDETEPPPTAPAVASESSATSGDDDE